MALNHRHPSRSSVKASLMRLPTLSSGGSGNRTSRCRFGLPPCSRPGLHSIRWLYIWCGLHAFTLCPSLVRPPICPLQRRRNASEVLPHGHSKCRGKGCAACGWWPSTEQMVASNASLLAAEPRQRWPDDGTARVALSATAAEALCRLRALQSVRFPC